MIRSIINNRIVLTKVLLERFAISSSLLSLVLSSESLMKLSVSPVKAGFLLSYSLAYATEYPPMHSVIFDSLKPLWKYNNKQLFSS